jgi:hypothetical protein
VSENALEIEMNPSLIGYLARTIWILGRPGIVSGIIGLDKLVERPSVLKILTRFLPGEHLSEDMIGTERQVLMRIYTLSKSEIELDETTRYISETVRVIDHNGNSLISDIYIP